VLDGTTVQLPLRAVLPLVAPAGRRQGDQLNINHEDFQWEPSVEQLGTVLGLAAAFARDDGGSIQALSSQLTIEECGLACLALTQLLLARLADATDRSVDEVVTSLAAELRSSRG
jgi:hypothetical protein